MVPASPGSHEAGSKRRSPPVSLKEACTRQLVRLRPISPYLGASALVLVGLAFVVGVAGWGLFLLNASAALALAAVAAALVRPADARLNSKAKRLLQELKSDPDTVVLTDVQGKIRPAEPGSDGLDLQSWLEPWCAEPKRVIETVLDEVQRGFWAERSFRRGAQSMRLTAHLLGGGGGVERGLVLWRFARVGAPSQRGIDALGLALATLGPERQPIAANPALLRLIDLDEGNAPPDPAVLAKALRPVLAQLDHSGPSTWAVAGASSKSGAGELPKVQFPGGREALALLVPAWDGQQDILFLPAETRGFRGVFGGLTVDFEEIPIALLLLDAEGGICASNRAARQLLGLPPTEERFLWEVVEGLGRPIADWLSDARAGKALNRPEVVRAPLARGETFVQIVLRRLRRGRALC